MIKKIKNLTDFITYCEQISEVEEGDSNDENWTAYALVLDLSHKDILDDITHTLDIYYSWLSQAQEKEMFISCTTIYEAISIENKHYNNLGIEILGYSMKGEIDEINTNLKSKYLWKNQ